MENRDIVEKHAVQPSMTGAQDFALVVGVDHYPQFRGLRGAVADATAFHAWVCHPDGGAVAHARLILSTPNPPQPVQAQVDAALVELFTAAEAIGGARRLYLYFAGHGAMCVDTGDDVALLLATWSLEGSRLALSSNGYRSALSGLGLFAELVLFLDCCRVTAANAIGMPPTFSLTPRLPGAARTFVAYATEAGHTAQEHSDAGAWRGVFTQRLLAILRRSEHGVHASHLKSLLEHEARVTGQRAHVVDGLLPGSTFGRRGTPPMFQVLPNDEHGDIELFDGFGRLVAVHAAINGRWELPLPAGLYKLVYGSVHRRQRLIDHTAPTRLDFRPRLQARLVRTWTAADTDRVIPSLSAMHELALDADSVELAPGVHIHRDGDCYEIEADHGGLIFDGRIAYLHRKTPKPCGTHVRIRQLRDGDLFRYGTLRILVGNIPDPVRARVAGAMGSATAHQLDAQRSILHLKASPDVAIFIYDAVGREVARGSGNFDSLLPHGLYRIDAELCGVATSQVIEHDAYWPEVKIREPQITTPAVFISSNSYYRKAVRHYTNADTIAPIGERPHTSRLLVFVRDSVLQPMSIHDLRGQRLVDVSAAATEGPGYWVLACAIAPGTYILRAAHDLAITIPAGYNARIFVATTGLRISLAPVGEYDYGHVARAMEHVITAGRLPPDAIELARRAVGVGYDLCFVIAATHLTTGGDRAALLATLTPFLDVPDVAILHGRVPLAPPLFRASLRLALTDPAFDVSALTADAPLARAACLASGDPFWATWDSAAGTDTWIPATVAALLTAAVHDPVELARRLALPPACIQRR